MRNTIAKRIRRQAREVFPDAAYSEGGYGTHTVFYERKPMVVQTTYRLDNYCIKALAKGMKSMYTEIA